MNDRKVKGKPHIEAKQWARIINYPDLDLFYKVLGFGRWLETPQGCSFWNKTLDKIGARGR